MQQRHGRPRPLAANEHALLGSAQLQRNTVAARPPVLHVHGRSIPAPGVHGKPHPAPPSRSLSGTRTTSAARPARPTAEQARPRRQAKRGNTRGVGSRVRHRQCAALVRKGQDVGHGEHRGRQSGAEDGPLEKADFGNERFDKVFAFNLAPFWLQPKDQVLVKDLRPVPAVCVIAQPSILAALRDGRRAARAVAVCALYRLELRGFPDEL